MLPRTRLFYVAFNSSLFTYVINLGLIILNLITLDTIGLNTFSIDYVFVNTYKCRN